jgi:hypothetical protein
MIPESSACTNVLLLACRSCTLTRAMPRPSAASLLLRLLMLPFLSQCLTLHGFFLSFPFFYALSHAGLTFEVSKQHVRSNELTPNPMLCMLLNVLFLLLSTSLSENSEPHSKPLNSLSFQPFVQCHLKLNVNLLFSIV